MTKTHDLRLLSNYGAALLLIAHDDRAKIREIADALGLSERATQGIVADLVRGGYVTRRPEGRGYVYEVVVGHSLTLPLQGGTEVRDFLAALAGGRECRVPDFDNLYGRSGVPTAVVDLDGILRHVNGALATMWAQEPEEIVGHPWIAFAHPEDAAFWDEAATRLVEGDDLSFDQQRFLRPDGSIAWASIYVATTRDEDGEPLYYLVQMPDITDRKRIEEQLDYYDYYDALTGLPNRSTLLNRLTLALGESRRHARPFGVALLHLDHFKLIYATLGHEKGDELIRQVAVRIVTNILPESFAARVSDDDFVIVGTSVASAEYIVERVHNTLRAIHQPYESPLKPQFLSVSAGAVMSDGDASPESLLRDLDAAAERSRAAGSNRVELFDAALREAARRRASLLDALLSAQDRDEFYLHYQPIVDLRSRTLVGVEALLRWRHPLLGEVSPSEFVPLVEELGLIGEVGGWVVAQAIEQLARWDQEGLALSMSINVSVRQLLTTDLADVVKGALFDSDVDPGRVILELTESVLMEDNQSFTLLVGQLKDLGVRVSIDDFGTGYSSFGRLKGLPVDELKIDQSFIRGFGLDDQDTTLVEAIIAMARALRIKVTAEGIENAPQLSGLRLLGCERGQGFYLARPLAPDALAELARRAPVWPLA